MNEFASSYKERFFKPRGTRKYNGGEISFFQGSYKMEFIKGKNKTTITRPFTRIKEFKPLETKKKKKK